MTTKAELLSKSKLVLESGLVLEVTIWILEKNNFYPEGIKYRLLLADPVWKKVLLLFDNHAPKGHHWHDSNNTEHPYYFFTLELLLEEFRVLGKNAEKKYENNENKNSK